MSYQQALQASKAGNFQQALDLLHLVLEQDGQSGEAWYLKAFCHFNLGDKPQALQAVDITTRIAPHMASAHRVLAKLQVELGQVEPAIAAYKQAARCYLKQVDKPNAEACIQEAEKLYTRSTPLDTASAPSPSPLISSSDFLDQVQQKIQQQRYQVALQDSNWLLQIDPDHPEALSQRGLVYTQLHNYAAAVADFNQALKLDPQNFWVRLRRAQLRLAMEDTQGAIADCAALFKEYATDYPVELYGLRGQAYQQMKDFENAFKDFSNALAIDPSQAKIYQARAELQEELGDWQAALEDFRQAAKLYLDHNQFSDYQRLKPRIQTAQTHLNQTIKRDDLWIRIPIKQMLQGLPVVEVILNDRYSFDMVLDTEASITYITPPMATLLQMNATNWKPLKLMDGRSVSVPFGFVRTLALGAASANNLEVAVFAEDSLGMLGQNFLWCYHVHILGNEIELRPR